MHNFRKVKKAQRERTVSKPAADDFRCVVFGMHAGSIFWKDSLIRRIKTIGKRRAELASVRMAAQNKIKRIMAV